MYDEPMFFLFITYFSCAWVVKIWITGKKWRNLIIICFSTSFFRSGWEFRCTFREIGLKFSLQIKLILFYAGCWTIAFSRKVGKNTTDSSVGKITFCFIYNYSNNCIWITMKRFSKRCDQFTYIWSLEFRLWPRCGFIFYTRFTY